MVQHHRWMDKNIQREADRQTAGLLGIVVILVLIICCLFLVQQLRSRARLEDCQLSGRTDCASLAAAPDDVLTATDQQP